MTHFKRYLVLLTMSLLLFSFSNCGGSRNGESNFELTSSPPFTLGEVYFQNWVAGVRDGGSGTHVSITFENMDDGVRIKNIYFHNKMEKAQQSEQNPSHYMGYFSTKKKGDVIMDINPAAEAQNRPPEAFPFNLLDNEAVISYYHKEKIGYFKLVEIKEKPLLAYPQSNPIEEN